MANWCSNMVVFEGKPEAIGQLQQLFKSMAEKEQEEECGQLPKFISEDTGYFFNIYWNDYDEGIFQYESKWSPNMEAVRLIADFFGLEFTHEYEEMGNRIYGKVTYADGIWNETALTDEDLEQYQYDEKTDRYHFEGEEYESDSEILETLLERKISF